MLRSILLATCFVVSAFSVAASANACGCKDKKVEAVEKACDCKKSIDSCDSKK